MSKIQVTDRDGEEASVDIHPDTTLMQAITDAGYADLLALCGGMCACGTCHVYVDETQLERLADMGPDEDELLSASGHRRANSRLSCQIRVGEELAGLRVTIAPED